MYLLTVSLLFLWIGFEMMQDLGHESEAFFSWRCLYIFILVQFGDFFFFSYLPIFKKYKLAMNTNCYSKVILLLLYQFVKCMPLLFYFPNLLFAWANLILSVNLLIMKYEYDKHNICCIPCLSFKQSRYFISLSNRKSAFLFRIAF